VTEQTHPLADRLETRLEFETLVSDTSAALFAAPPDHLDLVVQRALERLRAFFHADRCALLRVSADQQVVTIRLASYAQGIASVSPDINLAQLFPWTAHRLLVERMPIRISKIGDLPPEAGIEVERWSQMPIRSALTLPIEIGGLVSHLILLNTVHREWEWPDAYMTRLRVFGEMLVSALERGEMIAGLREAEARLSLAADSAEAGLWTLDCSTGVFWAAPKARVIFGYSTDEVITLERFEATVHADDLELVREAIEHSLLAGAPINLEYRILRPSDGALRWISSRGRPSLTPTGDTARLMGVSIDITTRRRATEALQRSEARLGSAADLAGLGFYEIDYIAGVGYVDDRFRAICGLPMEQIPGLQFLEFWTEHLHPDDREWVLDARQQLHDGQRTEISVEYRYLDPAAGQKWIHHLARISARDATGHALVAFGVLRDITARKQAENELRDLSQRLILAHEEERALLARELHDDLSQRLAVMAIDVGRAELAALDEPQAKSMRAVREGLARLSEDIHTLAYQLHPSVLTELGLAEALRTECERIGRRGRVELSLELDPLPADVGKDAALCLFRVAQEALSNAIRHAGARSVRVVLEQRDGGLRLAVRDDGAGFDPASAKQRRSLGLASMRERLRLVNGTLDIESMPGRGTVIAGWVPVELRSR
jgi:PAS domain S-box-containing protein